MKDRRSWAMALAAVLAVGAQAVWVRPAQAQSAAVRRMTEGQQLFRTYCASCHGLDGRGNGPVASALKDPPADLTMIAGRNGGVFPRDRVTAFVTNGDRSTAAHGSQEMPVWGPTFTALAPGSFKPVNDRIRSVVAYIESIQLRK
jgi:mono/diheme cytochrome c family protein